MIDIKAAIKDPEKYRRGIANKGYDPNLIDRAIELYKQVVLLRQVKQIDQQTKKLVAKINYVLYIK